MSPHDKRRRRLKIPGALWALSTCLACGGPFPVSDAEDAGSDDILADAGSPFIVEVTRFSPGEKAGYGQDAMPEVVFGPPAGQGLENGSRDVLSLGLGGVIEVRLGRTIIDGDGIDFVVFENPFACTPGSVFAEPAEVSVSADGETWHTFLCTPPESVGGCVPLDVTEHGCAGLEPVFANPERGLDATSATEAGGDGFDLAELGLTEARFVRIEDKGVPGPLQGAPTAGFDLDAIAVITGP